MLETEGAILAVFECRWLVASVDSSLALREGGHEGRQMPKIVCLVPRYLGSYVASL